MAWVIRNFEPIYVDDEDERERQAGWFDENGDWHSFDESEGQL